MYLLNRGQKLSFVPNFQILAKTHKGIKHVILTIAIYTFNAEQLLILELLKALNYINNTLFSNVLKTRTTPKYS